MCVTNMKGEGMNIINKLNQWHCNTKNIKRFTTMSRKPFYDMVAKYLPKFNGKTLLDIGAGSADFATHLGIKEKYQNLYLLDANDKTIALLKERGYEALLYKVPDRLPFDDHSVSFVHTSHLVEHLEPNELYKYLIEIDRVLESDGIVVISAPMLWCDFYHDLSHVRPYNPSVFINYLCKETVQRSADTISSNYYVCDLAYRYTKYEPIEWKSEYIFLDAFLFGVRKALSIMRIAKYHRNGFTVILRKSEAMTGE